MSDDIDVLLVEDDDNDVDLTLRSLRGHGMSSRIEIARNGEAALDFLFCRGAYEGRSKDKPPKMVLLDLKLPRVQGLELLREIKERPSTREIPVVVLTSSNLDVDVKRAYQLGANSYIVKPVDFVRFSKAVADAGAYWTCLNRPSPPPF